MTYSYLICPTVQIVDSDGKPYVGAKFYIYNANTTNLATTYKDFNGTMNTNPVIADSLGNVTIIADTDLYYDLVVKTPTDEMIFTKKNLKCATSITEGEVVNNIVKVVNGNGITVSANTVGDITTYTVSLNGNGLIRGVSNGSNVVTETTSTNPDGTTSIRINAKKSTTKSAGRYLQWNKTDTDAYNEDIKISLTQEAISKLDNPGQVLTAQLPIKIDNNVITNNGSNNTIEGVNAWASGYGNTTYGSYNFVHGVSNTAVASSSGSAVFGSGNTVSGGSSNVFGVNNTVNANAKECFIGGYNNTLNSSTTSTLQTADTFVYGQDNVVQGKRTAVFGDTNNVEPLHNSLVAGIGLTASRQTYLPCTILGCFNSYSAQSNGSDILIIGNGSMDTERSNALEIGYDGKIRTKYDSDMRDLVPYYMLDGGGSYGLPENKDVKLNINVTNYTIQMYGESSTNKPFKYFNQTAGISSTGTITSDSINLVSNLSATEWATCFDLLIGSWLYNISAFYTPRTEGGWRTEFRINQVTWTGLQA